MTKAEMLRAVREAKKLFMKERKAQPRGSMPWKNWGTMIREAEDVAVILEVLIASSGAQEKE